MPGNFREKGSDAGSLHDVDQERDPEKVLGSPTAESESEANVGLHEFDVAKQAGLRVTPEENRR